MLRSPAALNGQTTRVRPLSAAVIFFVGCILVLLVPRTEQVYVHGMVIFMFFCCVAPALMRWHSGKLDVFESVHVIGLLYFLFFGAGAIWTLNDPVKISFDIYVVPFVPVAVLYCLLGYLALLAGYFGPWFRGRAAPRWEEIPRGGMFLLLPGVLGFAGAISEAAWSYSRWLGVSFPTILSTLAQLAPLFLFSWALSWLLVFSGRATRRQKYVVYGFSVPAALTVALATLTDKSLGMTLAGVPVMALWYAKRRIPWKPLLALALLLVFVVFPFYNTFRVLDPRIPWADRVGMTVNQIRDWDLERYQHESIGKVERRFALINSVAVVVRDVPRWVPYEHGATLFLPAIGFFIPRVLWPDKPLFTMGRRFAETFRVVNILDTETNVSVTVPGELYWNFDLPGILLGMALWGVVLRYLYRRYGEADGVDPVRRAIHIVLLVQFVHFGGGLAAQVVSMMRTLVVFEVYRWLARQGGILRVGPVRPAAE